MASIVLGVTGSVAAMRVPALASDLISLGHSLRVVATESSLYFFDPAGLPQDPGIAGTILRRDLDEWPGSRYQRGDEVLHIELRRWADLLVVAPLDANTLAKFALGLADNLLTCLFRAWDFARPLVLAPAMNTLMWHNPATLRHLRLLLEDHGNGNAPASWSLDDAVAVFARHAPKIILVPPVSKALACGDIGQGAMAEVVQIASIVQQTLNF